MTSPQISLHELLIDGAEFRWGSGDSTTLSIEYAGDLALPTGRLTVRDPSWPINEESDDSMVMAELAPGNYSVMLSVLRSHAERDGRSPDSSVAAAALMVRPAPVVAWEPARADEDDPEEPLCFSVDSGVGCFADEANIQALVRLQSTPEDLFGLLRHVGRRNPYLTIPANGVPAQLLFFSCGMGDGTYPVWTGRDKEGKAVTVLADLEILHHSVGRI
jgi:Protein of unknown function (DUF4241)